MNAQINELFEEGITRSGELSDAADEAMNAVDALAKQAEDVAQRVEEEGREACRLMRDTAARLKQAEGEIETARGRPIRIDEATAQALGVGVGGVVELVNPRGAPLRAWVTGLLPGNGSRAALSPAALRMLAAGDDEVEIRAVHSGALGG